MSAAEARARFYEAVQGGRLDMADYDNNPARRDCWERAIEREEAKSSTHESTRDYLAWHVTLEQEAEVAAFIDSLPEPEGTLQEVFERAQEEAMEANTAKKALA